MFTGLIQEMGEIVSTARAAGQNRSSVTRITIKAGKIPSELKTGDSVAVSGVCLTALEIGEQQFSADLAEETLQRTSLQRLKTGSLVNLELPAQAQDRMGGHVVQGHVDGVGSIVSLEKIKYRDDWRLIVELPSDLSRYVVPQGSITVEGISLTVAAIEGNRVEIAIIPHTWQATNLRTLRDGNPVNIEVDVLAKYAEKMARGAHGKLTAADLIQRGF
ncbi:MAG: riboflavin synthase, alpha subunit [Candidatus Angelobacter sp.]|nr:riboflavin synthase, alpha subunit [Candidatus Angelobacter sp.]